MEPLSRGLKRMLPARAVAPRKESSESCPKKIRMDFSPVRHNLQEIFFPTHPLWPNKNKNKFKRKKGRIDSAHTSRGVRWENSLREYKVYFLSYQRCLKVGFQGCTESSETQDLIPLLCHLQLPCFPSPSPSSSSSTGTPVIKCACQPNIRRKQRKTMSVILFFLLKSLSKVHEAFYSDFFKENFIT